MKMSLHNVTNLEVSSNINEHPGYSLYPLLTAPNCINLVTLKLSLSYYNFPLQCWVGHRVIVINVNLLKRCVLFFKSFWSYNLLFYEIIKYMSIN